jgi:SsrA-binding protein
MPTKPAKAATAGKGGAAGTGGRGSGTQIAVQNRRASFDYFLEDRLEAGLVLTGTEVKSLRGGKGSLVEAWVKVEPSRPGRPGEAWLMQCHIPEYAFGNRFNHEPNRPRKLLLHRREIDKLGHEVGAQGVTLVPTRIYFKDGLAKLEFAVGRGKNVADKRRTMAKRDAEREMARVVKERRRG